MTWDQIDLWVHEAMVIEERLAARVGVKTGEIFMVAMTKLFGTTPT